MTESKRRREVTLATGQLQQVRRAWRDGQPDKRIPSSFPGRDQLRYVIDTLGMALFPGRIGAFAGPEEDENDFVARHLVDALDALQAQIEQEVGYWQREAYTPFEPDQAETIVSLFTQSLAKIRCLIDSDVEAAFLGDPAACSVDEILVCYPGAIASLHHRIAHELDALGAPITARIISEIANERTGIDIHPGATIGPNFFIDHGTGVVIGATAIVGARVRLYQHVTLGARSPLGAVRHSATERYARHPIVEDDVVIYAGATILGRVTIGARSVIGGNVWLLRDVPPDSVLAQPEAEILPTAHNRQLRETLDTAGALS